MSQVINGWGIEQQDLLGYSNHGKWFVWSDRGGHEVYLHTDGSIQQSTRSPDGAWSGYFDTYEQAEAAAAKAPRQEVSP